MFVHYKHLNHTGTIIYENEQKLTSGLKDYNSPYELTQKTEFALINSDLQIVKSDSSAIYRKEILIVQFGQDEIDRLNDTGIKIDIERTQLQAFGELYRATKVDDFTRFGRNYYGLGMIQVRFEREIEE